MHHWTILQTQLLLQLLICPSYLDKYIFHILKPGIFPVIDEDICRRIIHHELRLDELLDSLDDHDLCAREFDSSEVGAWKSVSCLGHS
jgi:hypothetical protein